jgi:ParB family chromosome partitioning protein
LVLPDADGVDGLYRRMVDENVIRKDLSFAEMAHAARNFAADPATSATDLTEAVAALFQSAPYSKRSYIRSFAALLDAFEDVLRYPTEIPRALGVALARRLGSDHSVVGSIRQALNSHPDRDAAQEMDILRRFTEADSAGDDSTVQPPPARKGRSRTKTTFHITSSAGQVKCTAAQGRLEIKVDRDFSAIDRARLERAIADLIDGLG